MCILLLCECVGYSHECYVSGPLHAPLLVEISEQMKGKLSTSMTKHRGMHQRMWLSPSVSSSQSKPSSSRCGKVYMHTVIIKSFSREPCLWARGCVREGHGHQPTGRRVWQPQEQISVVARTCSCLAFPIKNK